jgi:hypothetical protein
VSRHNIVNNDASGSLGYSSTSSHAAVELGSSRVNVDVIKIIR